jgi:AraC family transcriptional regulator
MNYYERIQKAIDYIEKNLTRKLETEKIAFEACFSLSHFYRIFHALVGHNVKEYITKRRLSEAASRLIKTNDRIIEICFDYQFDYQESFSRAFKNLYGVSPGAYRKQKKASIVFPKIDLMEEYFIQDEDDIPGYKIKVLKRIKPMQVGYYRAISATPEHDAFTKLMSWANSQQLLKDGNPYRIFGFDDPSPSKDSPVYGYESWITINTDAKEADGVKIKEFQGGLYAVTGTTVAEIQDAWKNFMIWLSLSKYTHGNHQCLEELLSFQETEEKNIQIDLYLPIKE